MEARRTGRKEKGRKDRECVVETLSISGHDMRKFMELHGGNLETTEALMNQFGIETAALKLLASCNRWQHLEKADFSDNLINGDGLRMLVKCNWPSLQELKLDNNRIDADSVQVLGRAVWRHLVLLSLDRNDLDLGTARFQLMDFVQLAVLGLAGTRLQPNSIGHMPNWKCLGTLGLAENRLGEEGATLLARLQLPLLFELDLSRSKLGVKQARRLAGGRWRKLRTLTLNNNQLNDEAMRELSKSVWQKLQSLQLYDNPMTMAVFKSFQNANWPTLQSLSIQFLSLNEPNFLKLIRCNWPCLRYLNFNYALNAASQTLLLRTIRTLRAIRPHLIINPDSQMRRQARRR